MPDSAKASMRSRHLPHTLQCLPSTGWAQLRVNPRGRCDPRETISDFFIPAKGLTTLMGWFIPMESVASIEEKNSSVASGKGLFARDPSPMHEMPFRCAHTATLASRRMFLPGLSQPSFGS